MPPAKARNGHGHDDKNEGTSHGNGKDKDASSGAQSNHQVNGSGGAKMRRVASAAGSNLRDSVTADAAATLAAQSLTKTANSASNPLAQDPSAAGSVLQWSSADRPFLQKYRRVHRLSTPTSFLTDYHQWVIGRPGSIGLQSPTMRRTKTFRRQSRDDLVGVLKKHYNSQAMQENDVLVDFVHKVATTASLPTSGIPKPTRTRKKS
ncbi:hypothetical protein PspLS_05019 [Pyricularia sp. CBS 133598]|nr:hypothetical protein PspLS_05019 [Pyricularia sp. CBS 133598]